MQKNVYMKRCILLILIMAVAAVGAACQPTTETNNPAEESLKTNNSAQSVDKWVENQIL